MAMGKSGMGLNYFGQFIWTDMPRANSVNPYQTPPEVVV